MYNVTYVELTEVVLYIDPFEYVSSFCTVTNVPTHNEFDGSLFTYTKNTYEPVYDKGGLLT